MIIRKLSFLFFVLAIFISGFGQDESRSKIDSLESLIKLKGGAEKFDLIVGLMRTQLNKSPLTSLELSRQAETLALSMGDSLRIVKAKFARGFIFYRLDSISQAIRFLEDALPIAKRNNYNEELSKILNMTAVSYAFSGNPDKALAFHFQSIEMNERLGNKEDIAITHNNIGLVYFKMKDYENALNFYQKSLDEKNAISNRYDLDVLLVNMALCYNQLKRYQEAEEFIKRGLQICKQECDSAFLMGAELGLGVAASEQGRKEEAIGHFESSLLLGRKLNEKRYQIESLLNLALVSESQQNPAEALEFLNEAEKMAITTNYSLSLIDIYKLYSGIYSSQNDFKNASFYQSKYIALKDSIYSSDLISNLTKVRSNFEERENIKTIKEQDEILQLKQQLIDRQRAQYFYIVLVAVLTLGLALVLLFASRRQQKSRAEIAMAKEKIEEQNKLLEEQNKVLDHRVKDRTMELSKSNLLLSEVNAELDNFLYKTSHDIRGPIATMRGLCNLGLIDSKDPAVTNVLNQMVGQSDRMSKILGRLTTISDISQTTLRTEKIDFSTMLDSVLANEEENARSKSIQLSYEVADGLQIVSDDLMIRTVLENLVNNGIKFYNDSARIDSFVKVRVSQEDSIVNIRVIDNGIGIGADEVMADGMFHIFTRASERSETGGVGLYLSKLCSQKIGGQIRIEKSDNEGTIFLIQLPVDLVAILEKRRLLQADMQRILEEENSQKAKLVSFT